MDMGDVKMNVQQVRAAVAKANADRNVLTGREVTFGTDEIIVSKTDLKGRITYANEIFVRVSGFREEEIIGAPHSIIRHPAMPRCVFKFLWDRISSGNEIFAYVINRCKSGDHYWVFAHVTPSFGPDGKIVGYHSNRRSPDRSSVAAAEGLYRKLLEVEASAPDQKEGMKKGEQALLSFIGESGMGYDQLIMKI